MKLLHIIASPRTDTSNTLRVSNALLDTLRTQVPDLSVEVLDLFHDDLPAMAGSNIDAKYTLMVGRPIDRHHAESWHEIEGTIEQFLAADAYVVTTPLWNLSTPYALKYYIDCIVQPGYLFSYNESGQPVPLVHGKKMVVVTSSGSDYSASSPIQGLNFQEPYLRAIFGFVGITDITFVHGHAMDVSAEHRTSGTELAIDHARDVASTGDWLRLGRAAA